MVHVDFVKLKLLDRPHRVNAPTNFRAKIGNLVHISTIFTTKNNLIALFCTKEVSFCMIFAGKAFEQQTIFLAFKVKHWQMKSPSSLT